MARFRKKPVEIEAVQWKGDNREEVLSFCPDAHCDVGLPGIFIDTLEGRMVCPPNNWIIKGVAGEFYPCKPDIFEQTYELVEA